MGEFKREPHTKLLELSGTSYDLVGTQMNLSSQEHSVEVEADFQMDTFLVKYRKKHRTFLWNKFEKQRFFQYTPHDKITHLEQEYQFTLKRKENHLSVQLIDSTRVLHSIKLPKLEERIENFKPHLNATKTKAILMVTTESV